MAESTSKLRKQVKALTNVDGSGGVDILADEKTFRSTYDIMSDIAGVWEHMSDIDQSALLELLAGKVRSNQVAALLSNFDQAEKALKTSQTAEGTMDKVHRAWMDSVEARKAQFEAAQETLSMTVMPANTMKGLYQTGTSALSLLNTVIGGTGTLGFSAGVFGVANALRAGGGDIAAGLGSMLGLHRDTVNGGWTRGDLGFVTAYNEAFSELGDKTAAFKQATAGTSKTLDSYTMSLYNSTSGLIDARKVTTGFGSAVKSFAKNALVGIGTFAAMELAAYGINQAWNFVNSEILHRGETLGNRAAMAHAEAEQAQQTAEARKEEQQSIQQQIASIEQKGQTGGGLTSAEEAELMSLRSQLRVAQYRQEIAEAQAQAKAAKSVQSKTQSYEWDRSQEQNIGAALYTTMGGADAQHAFMSARQNAQNRINQLFEAGLDSTEEYLQTVADWQELDSYARKSYKLAADYANTPRGQALLKQYSEATPEGLEGRYQSMVANRTSALEGQFSEVNQDLAGIQARSETLAQLFDFISNTKNLSPEALGEAYQFASQEYDQLISAITATNGRAAAELGKEADSAFSQLREKNVAAGGALADRLTEMEAGAQGWLSDYFQAGGKVSDSQRAAMTDYINSYLGLREVSQPGRKLDAVRSLLAGTPLAEALMELDKLAAESKLTAESISGLKVDNVENAGQRVSDFLGLLGISLAQAAEMWNASRAESRKESEGGGTAPAKVDTYGERKTSVAAVFAAQEAGAKLWASTGYSGGMTLEDYETIADLDEGAYMDAIQYANGGLFFNKDIFNDIVQKKFTEELKGLQKNVFDAQKKYNDAAQRMVEQLRKKSSGASDFDETALKTANTDLQAAAKEIGGYRAMQAQIQNNMTDYANWLRNKGGAESGDMYDEIGSAAQAIVSGMTSGRVGTNQFEAAMRLYTGKEHFDVKNLSQNDMKLLRGLAGVDSAGNAVQGLAHNTLFGIRNSLQKLGVLGKDYGVLDPTMTAQKMADLYNAANGTSLNGELMTSVFMALNDYIQMPGNKYDISALEGPEVKAMHEASKEFADIAKQVAEGKADFSDLKAAADKLDTATNNAMLTSGNAEAAAEAAKNIAEQEQARQQAEYDKNVLDALNKIADNTSPKTEGGGEGSTGPGGEGGEATGQIQAEVTKKDDIATSRANAGAEKAAAIAEGLAADAARDSEENYKRYLAAMEAKAGSGKAAEWQSVDPSESLNALLDSQEAIEAFGRVSGEARDQWLKYQNDAEQAIAEGDISSFVQNMAALGQLISETNKAAVAQKEAAEKAAREERAKADKLAAQQEKAYERKDSLMGSDYWDALQSSSAEQKNAMREYAEAMDEAIKNGDWAEFNRNFAALNQMIRDVNDAAAKAAAEAEQTAREEQAKADKLAAQQDKALGRLENVLGSDDYIDAWSDANQQQRDQMQDLADAMGDAIEKGNWQEFNRNFAALNQLIGEINTAAEQAKAEAQQQALNAQLAEESDYIKDTLNDTAVEQAETATQGAMDFMADLGTQADVDAAIMQEYVDAANALIDSNADLVNAAGQGSKLGDAYEKLAVATAGDDLNALKAGMDEFQGALREAKLAQLETDRATQEEQDRQVAESEAAADAERRKLAEQQQHDRLLAEEIPDTETAVKGQKDQASARKDVDDAARAEIRAQADELAVQIDQLAKLTSRNAEAQETLGKAAHDLAEATATGSALDMLKAIESGKEAMASVNDQAAKELSDALTAGRELSNLAYDFFGDVAGTGLEFDELGKAVDELDAAILQGNDTERIDNAIKNLTPLLEQAYEALQNYQEQKTAEAEAARIAEETREAEQQLLATNLDRYKQAYDEIMTSGDIDPNGPGKRALDQAFEKIGEAIEKGDWDAFEVAMQNLDNVAKGVAAADQERAEREARAKEDHANGDALQKRLAERNALEEQLVDEAEYIKDTLHDGFERQQETDNLNAQDLLNDLGTQKDVDAVVNKKRQEQQQAEQAELESQLALTQKDIEKHTEKAIAHEKELAEQREAEAEEAREQAAVEAAANAQRMTQLGTEANALINANEALLNTALTSGDTPLDKAYRALNEAIAGDSFENLNKAISDFQQAVAEYQADVSQAKQAGEGTGRAELASEVKAGGAPIQMPTGGASQIEGASIEVNGDVDLNARPTISGKAMQGAGWTDVPADDYATVYTSSYSGNGNTVLATPIGAGGELYTPEQLDDYVWGLLEAYDTLSEVFANDSLGLILAGMADDSEEAINTLGDYAEQLHNDQEEMYGPPAETGSTGQQPALTEAQIDAIYDRADEVAQNVKDFTSKNLDGNEALMAAGIELANFVAGLGSEISPQELSQLTDKTQAMLDEAMGVVKEQEHTQEAAASATEQTGAGEQAPTSAAGGAGTEKPDAMTSASVEPEIPGKQQEVTVDTKNATISVPTGSLGISDTLQKSGLSALWGLEDLSDNGARPNGEALSSSELQDVKNTINSLNEALSNNDAQALSQAIGAANQLMQGNVATEAPASQTPASSGAGGGGGGATGTATIKAEVETPEIPTPDVSPVQIPVEVESAEVPTPEAPSVTIPVSYSGPGALSVPSPPAVVIPVTWGNPGPMPGGGGGGGGSTFTFSGTMAAASGTEDARGGTTLVDELGAELIEHRSRGTFELGTDRGARFTKLDPGDIVHNAKETRRILRRGKAMWRGGAASGKAAANVPDVGFGGPGKTTYTFSADKMTVNVGGNTASTSIQGGTMGARPGDALYKWVTSEEYAKKHIIADHENVTHNARDIPSFLGKEFLEWLKKMIDWIPTYLSVLKKKTTAFINAADDAIHYLSKNQLLDDAIGNVAEEIRANMQAVMRYQAFLNDMASKGFSQDMINNIKNGTIDIKQYGDEEIVKSIQAYQEYWNKLVACREALQSLNAQMETLSAQKLEHVVDYFDRIDGLLRDQQKTFESLLSMKRQYGEELKVTDYVGSLQTMEQVLANAQNEETALIQELEGQLGVDGDLVNAILKGGREVWDAIAEHVKKNTYSIVEDVKPEVQAAYEASREEKNTTLQSKLQVNGETYYRTQNGRFVKIDKSSIIAKPVAATQQEVDEIIKANALDFSITDVPVTPITDEEIVELGEKLGMVMTGGSEEALANFETIKSLLTTSWEHPLAIGSDTWYEYMSTLENLHESIYSTKTEIGELKDEMAEIPLTNLKTGFAYLETIRQNLEDTNSLLDAQGSSKYPDTFRSLISVGMKQIENLQEQNKLIQEQMDSLDPLSEKYQELRTSLNGNLDTIADIRKNQEEWNDEIIDLQIDRLKKQNDTYKEQLRLMQALDDLDKARQRRLLVYHDEGGFRYEADEDALEDAQEAANDAIYSSMINGLERSKENSNIYGPLGERLVSDSGIMDSLGNTLVPVIDKLSSLNFEPYYQSIVAGAEQSGLLTSMLNSIDMAKLLEASIGGNVSIDIGNMTLNEVQNAQELGDAIIEQLPGYLFQALYQKGAN